MNRILLICALAACGDSSSGDDTPPDAPVNPGTGVTIEVTVRGAPAPDVQVVFQAADSTVISVDRTDAAGTVGADLEAGGFVTVIQPRPEATARDVLSTFSAVEPGDRLHLDLDRLGPTDSVQFDLAIDADPDVAAVGYVVETSCGNVAATPATPTTVALIGCGPTADMLVVSLDDTNTPLRSHFHPNISLGGTVTLTGSYEDFTSASVDYTNLPDGIGFVGVFRGYATDRGRVFETTAGATGNGDGTASATVRVPATAGSLAITASTPFPASGMLGEQLIFDVIPAAGAGYTLDLGAAMLPPYAATPTYDPASRVASWTEAAGATSPDATRLRLSVFRDDIPEGRGWDWRLIGPRAGTTATFPRLPADADGFDFNVAATDTVSVPELTMVSWPDGFSQALREHGFADLVTQLTGTGRLVTQDLYSPEL